ncbi:MULTISPECIES: YSC84-related protein [unclassified Wenzhouxiangella]|uniref:lipid-binding SYLF domain-containing protein n=1 Tax=unclassified Wenzhouxiangella TaxID=2613841 RepID=UPI0015F251B9|nr:MULTISPECIES: YSC84-related protein [unclassified Wenzhouxiangella]
MSANVRNYAFLPGLILLVAVLSGCASAPSDDALISESRSALATFIDKDPGLQRWVDQAYGYAVFPNIGKGGFWVGGGFGRGIVFEEGRPVGRASASQATIGPQIGAQSYSQVIFFRDEAALRRFQRESFEFSAQATAVAATEGRSATTSYERGVAVFNHARGGLMAEASVGGQKFRYWSL